MSDRFYDDENFPEDLFSDMGEEGDETYDGADPAEAPDDYDYEREREEISRAIELERRQINQKVLFRTIRSLERSWLWRFRGEESKSKIIAETYARFQKMITDGDFETVEYAKE